MSLACGLQLKAMGGVDMALVAFYNSEGTDCRVKTAVRRSCRRQECIYIHIMLCYIYIYIYPLVNKHRPWKSPIFNGNEHLPSPMTARVELLIYQRVYISYIPYKRLFIHRIAITRRPTGGRHCIGGPWTCGCAEARGRIATVMMGTPWRTRPGKHTKAMENHHF